MEQTFYQVQKYIQMYYHYRLTLPCRSMYNDFKIILESILSKYIVYFLLLKIIDIIKKTTKDEIKTKEVSSIINTTGAVNNGMPLYYCLLIIFVS